VSGADTPCPDQWWIVDLDAREIAIDNGAGGVREPTSDELAGAPRGSSLWVQIGWLADVQHEVLLDLAAGARYAVYGTRVEVRAVGPELLPASLKSTVNTAPAARLGDRVTYTLVEAQISPACSEPLGDRFGRLTQRVEVDSTDGAVVPVPVNARRVQVLEQPLPAAPSTWTWGAFVSTSIGEFSVPASQASPVIEVPGPARRLSAPPGPDRLATLVWDIEW
jgi:hypothetical protein